MEVELSVKQLCDERRSFCTGCGEVFLLGVQHGRKLSAKQNQWVLTVSNRGGTAYTAIYLAKEQAEQGLIEYLRKEEDYDGPDDIAVVADWFAERDDRLGAEILEAELGWHMPNQPTEFLAPPYRVDPPPKTPDSEPLWRTIYIIDVHGVDIEQAAKTAFQIVKDPASWSPILDIMDSNGVVNRIDLSELDGNV